jgi:hypothetical protein
MLFLECGQGSSMLSRELGVLTKSIERCTNDHEYITLDHVQSGPILFRYLIRNDLQSHAAQRDKDTLSIQLANHLTCRRQNALPEVESSDTWVVDRATGRTCTQEWPNYKIIDK